MKKFLLCLQLLFLTTIAYATGQDGDVIYIDGTSWVLLGRPICTDPVLCHDLKAVLPDDRPITTSNWDGFTAYWSIQHDRLYLDSVRCESYDLQKRSVVGERIPADTLMHVFKNHVNGGHIVASWLTGEIRVAKGKVLTYQHMGFERNYEEEMVFNIDKGKVLGRKEYHNYVVDGFSFENFNPKNNEELRKMFPLNIGQYPELANVKRIVFNIKKAKVDAQGNLVECEVSVLSPGENKRLAAEMAEALKAYSPWKVSFINGEYRANGIAGYVFPYLLE